jgi:hypothetical protein
MSEGVFSIREAKGTAVIVVVRGEDHDVVRCAFSEQEVIDSLENVFRAYPEHVVQMKNIPLCYYQQWKLGY